jgi:hypothetical protein
MSQNIDNAILGTDLDAQNFNLLNVSSLTPVPSNVTATTDPRLSDQRVPQDGSVTDAKVASAAGIQQSKLNLNSVIPASWLGTTATTAAQGNLAEMKSNKGAVGGYAALDAGGKIPVAQLPASAGVGTVTSVALAVDNMTVSGGPITSSGTLTGHWNSIPNGSWFGNSSGGTNPPAFQTTPVPATLIPALDASIITTGTIATARLPVSVGVGAGAASGLVPFPGATTGPGILSSDYLGRDMLYHAIPVIPTSYRPTIPAILITVPPQTNVDDGTGEIFVVPSSNIAGVTFFYSFTGATGPFTEMSPNDFVYVQPVTPGPSQVWFYGSRVGYNDSAVATYTNPNPT